MLAFRIHVISPNLMLILVPSKLGRQNKSVTTHFFIGCSGMHFWQEKSFSVQQYFHKTLLPYFFYHAHYVIFFIKQIAIF